ncbi:MAG: hypothetical protein ACREBC_26070, partial [Pyrinomonadaceae bacterium]
KKGRRRTKHVFEHRPKELHISVNGFVLGTQTVSSRRNELTLNVNLDEKIAFVEVFSERDVRLFFLNVESPPEGSVDQLSSVELSDGRALDLALNFSDTWPKLHAVYVDPLLAEVGETDAEALVQRPTSNVQSRGMSRTRDPQRGSPDGVETVREGSVQEASRTVHAVSTTPGRGLRNHSLLDWMRSVPPRGGGWVSTSLTGAAEKLYSLRDQIRTFDSGLFTRPVAVTVLLSAILVGGLLVLRTRTPVPPLTAANLLRQSSVNEQAILTRPNQVLHQTIRLEERKSPFGDLIASRRIEVWQSAERGIAARRLYDERNRLIAGDWRRNDGVQTLYHHGTSPRIQLAPEQGGNAAAVNFDNVWQLSPSAKDFVALIGSADQAQLEERSNAYVITYEAKADRHAGTATLPPSPRLPVPPSLIRATLVLNRADLHPTEQTLLLRRGDETREYKFTESLFERKAASAVSPGVFEPEAELLSSSKPETRNSNPEAVSPLPLSP